MLNSTKIAPLWTGARRERTYAEEHKEGSALDVWYWTGAAAAAMKGRVSTPTDTMRSDEPVISKKKRRGAS